MELKDAIKANTSGAVATLLLAFLVFLQRRLFPILGDNSYFVQELSVYYIEVIVLMICAYGIFKHSRLAALIVFITFLGERVLYILEYNTFSGYIITIAFLYYFFNAVRGTYYYHKIVSRDEPKLEKVNKYFNYIGLPLITLYSIGLVINMLQSSVLMPSANSDISRCSTLYSQQRYNEAYNLCKDAAEQGNAESQFLISGMYFYGEGITQDYTEAERWSRAAAEQGYDIAQFLLGKMNFLGNGVIQDYVLAYMWLKVSAANGNVSAAEIRNLVSEQMSNDQIIQAQALARQCVNSNYTDCGY